MELRKVNFATAAAVCADITLSDEAHELLDSTAKPPEFLQQLITAGHQQDAVRFLARALPARESAWWACLSARHGVGDATPAELVAALELAEKWVFKPTDENRYSAQHAAESLDNGSPVYWAAMSVFWSGGSMAPVDVPEVPVDANMCAMAVSGAVLLAGLSDDVDESSRRYQLFLKQGIAIANGDNARQVVQ